MRRSVYVGLVLTLLMIFLLDLHTGAYPITGSQLVSFMFHPMASASSMAQQVFWHLRIPHVLAVMMVGAAFAGSGVIMQAIFRNPLADPTLLGVSTGAQLLLLLGWLVLPVLDTHMPWMPLLAFVGGLLSMSMLYFLAHHLRHSGFGGLLLVGVALTTFFGAAIALLWQYLNTVQLKSALLWSFGGIVQTNGWLLVVAVLFLVAGMVLLLRQAKALDIFALGELNAQAAGVNLKSLKRHALLGVALLIAPAVALAGTIAFIGLIVPHMVRLVLGPRHQSLIGCAVLVGAILLVCTDMMCRLPVWHQLLPMGVVTALYGAPVFIGLLYRQQRRVL